MREITWPADTVLSCIIRGDRTLAPSLDDTLEAHDELLFVMSSDADPAALEAVLHSSPSTTAPTA